MRVCVSVHKRGSSNRSWFCLGGGGGGGDGGAEQTLIPRSLSSRPLAQF